MAEYLRFTFYPDDRSGEWNAVITTSLSIIWVLCGVVKLNLGLVIGLWSYWETWKHLQNMLSGCSEVFISSFSTSFFSLFNCIPRVFFSGFWGTIRHNTLQNTHLYKNYIPPCVCVSASSVISSTLRCHLSSCDGCCKYPPEKHALVLGHILIILLGLGTKTNKNKCFVVGCMYSWRETTKLFLLYTHK